MVVIWCGLLLAGGSWVVVIVNMVHWFLGVRLADSVFVVLFLVGCWFTLWNLV